MDLLLNFVIYEKGSKRKNNWMFLFLFLFYEEKLKFFVFLEIKSYFCCVILFYLFCIEKFFFYVNCYYDIYNGLVKERLRSFDIGWFVNFFFCVIIIIKINNYL